MSLASAEPPLSQPSSESFEGQVVGGKYQVGPMLGSGGMGTVWSGTHMQLGTRVAIKFIRPLFAARPDARRRFEIEARAAASVNSRHAVKVFDYGVSDQGLPYIVMEYLEGESLSDRLIRRGPMGPEEVARVIQQAAKGLSKAHAAGIVHRDLKPDNIFLSTNVEPLEGESLPYVVKLVDFGIAKMLDNEITGGSGLSGPTQEGSVIGTPNFMSPEQLTVGGTPHPLTDIWSLGACAFAAFTARIPFEGEVLGDIVLKVCVEPLPLPSRFAPEGVPEGLDAWFARACHRESAKRFQSVEELSDQLTKVCGLGAVRVATLTEDRVQYALRASSDDLAALPEDMPTGTMNAKTALLAGVIVGVALMVGTLGFFAWREKMAEEAEKEAQAEAAATTASVPASASAAAPAARPDVSAKPATPRPSALRDPKAPPTR